MLFQLVHMQQDRHWKKIQGVIRAELWSPIKPKSPVPLCTYLAPNVTKAGFYIVEKGQY
jgi:hypothetical protein